MRHNQPDGWLGAWVCSIVEGRTEGMGRMKERRPERVAPLADNRIDGSDGVVLAVGELRADWMASWSTGEALMTFCLDSKLAVVA